MRIAVVDDDREITAHLVAELSARGLLVEAFASGAAAKTALARDTFDAVVIDWNMPGQTGIEIVREATATLTNPPPFLIMTSRSDDADIVAGLEAGASDYIVKPANVAILHARIQAAIRARSQFGVGRAMAFEGYSLDPTTQSISLHGRAIPLTHKEFLLAALLFNNLDRPLSRNYLLSQVWSAAVGVETRTLDVHISRIRNKLKLCPENHYVIQAVFGFGYRLSRYVDDQP